MNETVQPDERQNRYEPLKLLGYFAAIFGIVLLLTPIFSALESSGSLGSFARLHERIANSLDITRQRDDAIVTIWSLLNTVILVFPIGWVYAMTKSREGYDRTLVQTLILMAMVVCGMMMIIQDQFSRALALVGVVSAVRFRTNVKDPKDAVYLLAAIGVGMGSGLGVFRVALWMALIMSFTFYLLSYLRIGEQPTSEASFVDIETEEKKKKKKKKKDKEKEKDKAAKAARKAAAAAGDSTADAGANRLSRIADSLEDPETGVKRPNQMLVVETADPEPAGEGIRRVLASHDLPYHQVGTTIRDGATRLEFLIRVDGDRLPPAEIAAEIEDELGQLATTVETGAV